MLSTDSVSLIKVNEIKGYDNEIVFYDLDFFKTHKLEVIKKVSKQEDIEKLIDKIEIESKSLDEVFRSAGVKDANLSSMPVLKPVADKYVSRLASGYGSRFHPILKVVKS